MSGGQMPYHCRCGWQRAGAQAAEHPLPARRQEGRGPLRRKGKISRLMNCYSTGWFYCFGTLYNVTYLVVHTCTVA